MTSEYAHAKILKIDIQEAKKIEGVQKIILGNGFPLTGDEVQDRPILAFEKVRYFGEPIAAVIAKDPYIAEHAANLVKVTYALLPVLQSPTEAVQENAPILHEQLGSYEKLRWFIPKQIQISQTV